MQKEIKRIIESKLFSSDNTEEWQVIITDYYDLNKDNEKGVALKSRYFDKKNYWGCLRELQKVRFYSEKDNFYRLVNEIITDIAVRASYKGILNPYDFELLNDVNMAKAHKNKARKKKKENI